MLFCSRAAALDICRPAEVPVTLAGMRLSRHRGIFISESSTVFSPGFARQVIGERPGMEDLAPAPSEGVLQSQKNAATPVITSASNLPLTFSPVFSSDDMAMILGTCSFRAAFICECESGRFVACNQRFMELLQTDSDTLEHQHITWCSFLTTDAPEVSREILEFGLENGETQLDTKLRVPDKGEVPVRVLLKALRWKQGEYFVGYIEDLTLERRREAELRREIQEQKGRAVAAISSSLRVYHLSEKIKWTPIITRDLLRMDCQEDLFREAAKLLTEEGSLNYREATFFFVEDDVLRVVYSTRDGAEDSYRLDERPLFKDFLASERSVGESDEGILLRLDSHGNLLGLCEVLPYEQEKEFFDGLGKISELQKDFLDALGDILALLVDNIRLSREIKRQSISDPLTSTFNRRYFMEQLHLELERATRYDRAVSLIFIDLDGFKEVNDIEGHLQGDQVLKEIGEILNQCFRETDVVCRYGGDEFIVLLPETCVDMAIQASEKLVEAVKNHPFVNIKDPMATVSVTVSAGVSTLTSEYNEDDFLQAADVALFKAKRQGKNGVASYP